MGEITPRNKGNVRSHGTWIVWVWSYTKDAFLMDFGSESRPRKLVSSFEKCGGHDGALQTGSPVVCFIKENGQRGVIVGTRLGSW